MGILYAFAHAISWGGTTVLLRPLSARLDPFVLNGMRTGFSLLLVLPLIWLLGLHDTYALLTWRDLALLWGSALLGGVVGDCCYMASLNVLGVARAFPIANCYPIVTVLYAALFMSAAVTPAMVAGMTIVLVGIYLVARPTDGDDAAPLDRRQLLTGVGLALAANLSWGLQAPMLALGMAHVDGLVATSLRVPVVVVVLLLIARFQKKLAVVRTFDRRLWSMLVIAGIVGWGVAGSLQALAVQFAGPSRTAIIAATAPIFASVASAIFLKERPTVTVWVGTAMTILGLVFVV